MKVKLIFLSAVALSPMAISAFAADLASQAVPPAPPPPVFTWTGLYVGGQVGYQWTTSSSGSTYGTATGALTPDYANYNSAGVLGGAHLGYNWQIAQFVLGIEGDIEGSTFYGSGPFANGDFRFLTENKVLGSGRVRLGYAWNKALFYATGGVAIAPVEDSYQNYTPDAYTGFRQGGLDDTTNTRVGYTVGGGFEYAFRPDWSVRAEYRYTDLGTHTDLLTNSTFGAVGDRRHETYNTARFGVSYHFSFLPPPAPAVARY